MKLVSCCFFCCWEWLIKEFFNKHIQSWISSHIKWNLTHWSNWIEQKLNSFHFPCLTYNATNMEGRERKERETRGGCDRDKRKVNQQKKVKQMMPWLALILALRNHKQETTWQKGKMTENRGRHSIFFLIEVIFHFMQTMATHWDEGKSLDNCLTKKEFVFWEREK